MDRATSKMSIRTTVSTSSRLSRGTYRGEVTHLKNCYVHHDEDLILMCKSCIKPICLVCSNTDHHQHEIEALPKYIRHQRSVLQSKCRVIRESQLPKIRDAISSINEATTRRIQAIKDQEHKLIMAVTQVAQKLLSKCRHIAKLQKTRILELKAHASDLKEFTDSVEKNTGDFTDSELVSMVQKYNALLGKTKQLDSPDEASLMKFQKGDLQIDKLESMFGFIDTSEYDKKMLMRYRVEEPENKFHVKEIGIFTNGSEAITSLFPVSPTNAWLYSDNSRHNKEVTFNGELKHMMELGAYSRDFFVGDEGNHVYACTDKTVRTVSVEKVDILFSTKPLLPLSLCKSGPGEILLSLVDNLSNSRSRSSTRVVQRMTLSGQVNATYQYENDGKTPLFTKPYRIALSSHKDIIVADQTGSHSGRLCVLDLDGRVRFFYEGKGGKRDFKPSGVCCDVENNVIVADSANHTIHIINQDGEFLRYLLTKKDGLVYPFSVAMFRDVLWIGGYYGLIKVYKVKHIK
ncbi:E3 ubiquitin-protein ligase TRIM71-like [Saccostrea echinata]|uniref:E3 ubiquitin-protein ligase TRIM71-like n=1 Tax=Saccostrea echinata TaxID=191078 RepID=UPI002A818249|nr:E3 ubiquitin-protein ligase TRIM71-like [Saccostrea echinata]